MKLALLFLTARLKKNPDCYLEFFLLSKSRKQMFEMTHFTSFVCVINISKPKYTRFLTHILEAGARMNILIFNFLFAT